ncbi:HAD-IA family hydrolase [Microcoleus sp. LEGE 07076]|uniref:HAD-IA family hydrolase n=1 Tax=Microcoleus sp. LEGE 07076 TaxID=915322 RepID=UPI001882C49E|nr:HAD-IA family hydrolase [Microcoleus sp. LEGE 07076]MBE9186148.1 HAD-IA family hydrolase [Microcoleus sp. LEGE 07076]
MTKVIIFDFDGTLADTIDILLSITNRLSAEFGFKSATKEEVAQLSNLTSWQILRYSGISIFKLPLLIRKLKAELRSEISEVQLFTGIKEVLLELKSLGFQLGIITSNSRENVLAALDNNNLQDTFTFIYSGSTFGKHKVINKWLRKEHINPEEVFYVGDEIRDIEAARKTGIKIIAVGWGFNSQEVLALNHPDFLIERPQQLIEIMSNLGGV